MALAAMMFLVLVVAGAFAVPFAAFVALAASSAGDAETDVFVLRWCFFVLWNFARARGRVEDGFGNGWWKRGLFA
jgi:asparagine N-glycosylation enzyme membrane subunit Stt3